MAKTKNSSASSVKMLKGGLAAASAASAASTASSASIEWMYLFILFLLSGIIAFMFYVYIVRETTVHQYLGGFQYSGGDFLSSTMFSYKGNNPFIAPMDELNNPYIPPLKTGYLIPSVPHAPINIKTRGIDVDFEQVGFLKDGENNILPLMGRNLYNGRDKSQYYTMTNTGAVNTRLPCKVKGRSCTGEYGCDSIYDGDSIFVEGLNKDMEVKLYENATFRYI